MSKKKLFIRILFGLSSLGLFLFSAVKVVSILLDYKRSQDLYKGLNDNFTKKNTASTTDITTSEDTIIETQHQTIEYDDDELPTCVTKEEPLVPAPIEIDWDGLKAINEDIVGWIYVEALPQISFPLVQGVDDFEYVHLTYDRQTSRAGCIYISSLCKDDMSSPTTIVYGHNMNDGSMFSPLYTHRGDGTFDENPYFWILTPEKTRRYEMVTIFQGYKGSDASRVFGGFDETFEAYGQEMLRRNTFLSQAGTLEKDDKLALLISCVPKTYDRTFMFGKCIQEN